MQVCTPYITLRNGRVLHAHEVGKQAFCFEVTEEENQAYLEKKAKKAKKAEKDKKDQ